MCGLILSFEQISIFFHSLYQQQIHSHISYPSRPKLHKSLS